MAQTKIIPLPLLLLLLINNLSSASTPVKTLVARITKDPLTSLYTLSLNNSPFLLDLCGPLLWSPCPPSHSSFPCNSPSCALANSSPSPHCHHPKTLATKRHHKKPSDQPSCTCTTSPSNPITSSCAPSDLTLTTLTLSSTTVPSFISSCAPPSLLRSLPAASPGVAGLSRSPLSLPTQLSSSLSLKPQLSLCLPPANSSGAAFFGDAPSSSSSSPLSFTPLLKNPSSPSDYYLPLAGIAVGGRHVPFLARMLEFDSLGHGGARLSTTASYTRLRSHIYRPFLRAFAEATKGAERVKRVRPFDLCLKAGVAGVAGLPAVDLMLAGGKNWTVGGESGLLVRVGRGVACLAFVDGGARAEQAVVVGGFQMEGRLLVFDLGRSRLGIGSGATCDRQG